MKNIFTLFVAINFSLYQFATPFVVSRALAAEAEAQEQEEVIEEEEEEDEEEDKEAESSEEDDNKDEEEVSEEGDESNSEDDEKDEEDTEEDDDKDEAKEDVDEENVSETQAAAEEDTQEEPDGSSPENESLVDETTSGDSEQESGGEDSIGVESENEAGLESVVESTSNTGENTANENRSGEESSGSAEEESGKSEEDDNDNKDEESDSEENDAEKNEEDPSTDQQEEEEETGIQEETGDEQHTEEATEIETGEAVALADIFNEINTNVYGEQWVESIINIYDVYQGDINLLELFESLFNLVAETENNQEEATAQNEDEEKASEEDDKDGDHPEVIEIVNNNEANIENTASAQANTGENEASGNGGDVNIETGDAYAMANVVNLVNLNIFGENWVFAVVNVFGDWVGDLIVPGQDLLSLPGATEYSDLEVVNENDAEITNTANSEANSGGNEANENGGEASITTGSAVSSSEVVNFVNTNIIGSNWLSLSVNDFGTWLGGVNNWFGADGNYSYDFASEDSIISNDSLSITNINTASIINTVLAYANSGNNTANENGGDAFIQTGNANSFANVMNLVNTNIIGDNWIFGVVNVFGSWEGDVEFAYPDLEISIDDGEKEAANGDELDYEITVKNKGLADAENAFVSLSLDGEASYTSSSKKTKVSSGKYAWELPGLAPEESVSFSVKARVKDSLVEDVSEIVAATQVETETEEKEMGNNSDEDSTMAFTSETEESVYVDYHDYEVDLDIERQRTINQPIRSGDIIYHAIIVENDSEVPLYDVKVKDLMQTQGGVKLISYEWEVGDLDVGDEILVEYQLLINGGATPGDYEFVASAKGDDPFDDEEVRSGKARLAMNIFGGGLGLEYIAEGGVEEPFTLIPTAQAVGPDNLVLGAASDALLTCNGLPLWIWFAGLAAYGLAINWALFPSRKGTEMGSFRSVAFPTAATLGAFAFWWMYRCDQMVWFLIGVLLILFMHLLVKKKLQNHSLVASRKTRAA